MSARAMCPGRHPVWAGQIMSYATNSDIESRLGNTLYVQLTDDVGSGSADEEKVSEARLAAEGEVNSYLGRRYAVPVDLTNHAELAAQSVHFCVPRVNGLRHRQVFPLRLCAQRSWVYA